DLRLTVRSNAPSAIGSWMPVISRSHRGIVGGRGYGRRVELTPQQALGLRMCSLLLRASSGAGQATGVAGVVDWLGAMQAQDLASGLWAFGVRLRGWTAGDVPDALER